MVLPRTPGRPRGRSPPPARGPSTRGRGRQGLCREQRAQGQRDAAANRGRPDPGRAGRGQLPGPARLVARAHLAPGAAGRRVLRRPAAPRSRGPVGGSGGAQPFRSRIPVERAGRPRLRRPHPRDERRLQAIGPSRDPARPGDRRRLRRRARDGRVAGNKGSPRSGNRDPPSRLRRAPALRDDLSLSIGPRRAPLLPRGDAPAGRRRWRRGGHPAHGRHGAAAGARGARAQPAGDPGAEGPPRGGERPAAPRGAPRPRLRDDRRPQPPPSNASSPRSSRSRPPTRPSCSSARRAPARSSSPAPSTTAAAGASARWSR